MRTIWPFSHILTITKAVLVPKLKKKKEGKLEEKWQGEDNDTVGWTTLRDEQDLVWLGAL